MYARLWYYLVAWLALALWKLQYWYWWLVVMIVSLELVLKEGRNIHSC